MTGDPARRRTGHDTHLPWSDDPSSDPASPSQSAGRIAPSQCRQNSFVVNVLFAYECGSIRSWYCLLVSKRSPFV